MNNLKPVEDSSGTTIFQRTKQLIDRQLHSKKHSKKPDRLPKEIKKAHKKLREYNVECNPLYRKTKRKCEHCKDFPCPLLLKHSYYVPIPRWVFKMYAPLIKPIEWLLFQAIVNYANFSVSDENYGMTHHITDELLSLDTRISKRELWRYKNTLEAFNLIVRHTSKRQNEYGEHETKVSYEIPFMSLQRDIENAEKWKEIKEKQKQ